MGESRKLRTGVVGGRFLRYLLYRALEITLYPEDAGIPLMEYHFKILGTDMTGAVLAFRNCFG